MKNLNQVFNFTGMKIRLAKFILFIKNKNLRTTTKFQNDICKSISNNIFITSIPNLND
jgi:hypothetical protein